MNVQFEVERGLVKGITNARSAAGSDWKIFFSNHNQKPAWFISCGYQTLTISLRLRDLSYGYEKNCLNAVPVNLYKKCLIKFYTNESTNRERIRFYQPGIRFY